MSKAMIGRLILEASAGMHGEESKILADAWADMAQQRAELLEALKKYVSESEEHDVGGGDVVIASCESREFAINAITKAEAAE